jgi:hypothetical protein
MMKKNNPAFDTVDDIKSYINLKLDILLLDISKKLSEASGYFVFVIIIGFIFLFVSLFLSLSLAEWLSEILHMPGLGNFIVSGIYIILGIFVYIYRNPLIIKPVSENMGKLMDMSDLRKQSLVNEETSIDEAMALLKQKLQNTENSIENNINNVKLYYSYEQIRDRFLESIMNNPKSILKTLLILREIIISRKKNRGGRSH